MYRYKLKEETPQTPKQYQQTRLNGFDEVIDLIGQIQPLLKEARKKTIKYYNNNPESYDVVYGTDLIKDYLLDITKILKK